MYVSIYVYRVVPNGSATYEQIASDKHPEMLL